MKKQELRQLIKEELNKVISENEDNGIINDIENDLAYGEGPEGWEIEYLEEIIDYCQERIQEYKKENLSESKEQEYKVFFDKMKQRSLERKKMIKNLK